MYPEIFIKFYLIYFINEIKNARRNSSCLHDMTYVHIYFRNINKHIGFHEHRLSYNDYEAIFITYMYKLS